MASYNSKPFLVAVDGTLIREHERVMVLDEDGEEVPETGEQNPFYVWDSVSSSVRPYNEPGSWVWGKMFISSKITSPSKCSACKLMEEGRWKKACCDLAGLLPQGKAAETARLRKRLPVFHRFRRPAAFPRLAPMRARS